MQSELETILATEFLHLGKSLSESLCKDLKHTLQLELRNALTTLAHDMPRVSIDTSKELSEISSSNHRSEAREKRFSVTSASDKEHAELPGASINTEPRVRIRSKEVIRFVRTCSEANVDEKSDDEGAPVFSLLRRGYNVKKAYDEMAPLVGLESLPEHLDSESSALRPPRVSDAPPSPPSVGKEDSQRTKSVAWDESRSAESTPKRNVSKSWEQHSTAQTQDLRKFNAFSKTVDMSMLSHASSRRDVQPDHHLERMGMRIIKMAGAILKWQWFDTVSASAICTYAFIIGLQTEMVAQNRWYQDRDVPVVFTVFEVLFCIIFVSEASVRIIAQPKGFFFGKMWLWNSFDVLLVVLQIFDIIVDLAVRGDDNPNTNVSFLRILRILRLVRVVRLLRVVRMLGEMRSILASIANSLKSLVYTLVLILFIVFTMGVFLCQLVSAKLSDDPHLRGKLKYFSTLSWSMYVLFQSLTGGADWGEAIEPLLDHISPLLAVPYCLYISFGVLCMLNVVTGVFVESACNSTAEEKDYAMVNRLQTFLCKSDSAQMTWEDFKERLDDPEIQLYFKTVDLDVSEAEGLFRLLDADDSGIIEAEEFVLGCLRLRGSAKAVDLATLMYENRRWHRRFDRVANQIACDMEEITSKLSAVDTLRDSLACSNGAPDSLLE